MNRSVRVNDPIQEATPPSRLGYRIYSPSVLTAYDRVVHGFSNPWIWKFPTRELRDLYQRCVAPQHLELGVGSGYLLRDPVVASRWTRLRLADANPACLEFAVERLRPLTRTPIEVEQLDLAQHLPTEAGEPFASVGLNFVLHCLPSASAKVKAIEHLRRRLSPEGVGFGATLLGEPTASAWETRTLERLYQRWGIFGNRDDSAESLESWFQSAFEQVETWQRGRAWFFIVSRPRMIPKSTEHTTQSRETY